MKWQRLLIVGALAMGLAVGCGDDPEPVEVDSNDQNQQDNQQDNEQENQEELDEFAEAADVWIGDDITAEQAPPTPVQEGEVFGGRFNENQEEPVHSFAVDVMGGQVMTVSIVDLESGVEQNLNQMMVAVAEMDEQSFFPPTPRLFSPQQHEQREFFVTETATHTVDVTAPGGEEGGFLLTVETEPVETDGTMDLPGTVDGDLDDATIDVYEVQTDELTSAVLEVFALRPPVDSQLDSWIYIYDTDTGRVPWDGNAESNAQSQDNYDPLLEFDFEPGTNYWVVMDMYANHTDAAYQIQADLLDTSVRNPMELGVGDSFDGRIEDRESASFFDYFTVTVDPGEFKKVVVEADGELQPGIELSEQPEEGEQATSQPVEAYAVDGVAAATLGVGEDEDDPVTFTVDVTDYRNLMQDPQDPDAEYVGGDGYEYTISVEDTSPQLHELDTGDSAVLSLDSPGELELIDVFVDDGYLLWLDGGISDFGDVDDIADLGLIPTWAFADETTLDDAHQLYGYQWGDDSDFNFLLRDRFFRGDDEDFETEVTLHAFDADAPDYQSTDLSDGNESFGDAVALDVPAQIEGEFEEPEDDGTGFQQDPNQEVDPETYYFEIDAEAGDHIVVHTKNAVNNISFAEILDQDEETLSWMGLYMEQRQEAQDEQHRYYDGAVVHPVEDDGSYVLAVEQYCQMTFMGPFCTYGDVEVNVFIASGDDGDDGVVTDPAGSDD